MTPSLRKFALTVHVTVSVGWLGAVACFLALAATGLTSQDPQLVRGVYLAMELTAWLVIVPLSLASPISGLVQSLVTTWGLFRHYWILVKFLITIPATIVLLLHLQPIGHMARAVAHATLVGGELKGLRVQLVANASAALLVLLVATALSIYKPRGLTSHGRRKQSEQSGSIDAAIMQLGGAPTASAPNWMKFFGIFVALLMTLFILLHLLGAGLGSHAR